MKRTFAAMLAVLFVIGAVLPVAASLSVDGAVDVTGTIRIMKDEMVPGENAEVTITPEGGGAGRTEKADSDGKVSFSSVTSAKYTVEIKMDPFGVKSICKSDFSELPESPSGSGKYEMDLTSDPAEFSFLVIMSAAEGTLKGTVTNEKGSKLSDVKIEVRSGGETIKQTLSRDGTYEISKIPIGTYDIRMSRSDLESQTVESVYIGEQGYELHFDAKTRIYTYVLGLDLPHSLMFTGVVMGIAVIAVVAGYRVLISRRTDLGDMMTDDD